VCSGHPPGVVATQSERQAADVTWSVGPDRVKVCVDTMRTVVWPPRRVAAAASAARVSDSSHLNLEAACDRGFVVGKAGFEPATSASRTLRAAQLRHFPLKSAVICRGKSIPHLWSACI